MHEAFHPHMSLYHCVALFLGVNSNQHLYWRKSFQGGHEHGGEDVVTAAKLSAEKGYNGSCASKCCC